MRTETPGQRSGTVFYAGFRGQVIVGLEASGYSPWFERLLEELNYEVWLGHATEIMT